MVIKGLQGGRKREAETNTQILPVATNWRDKTLTRIFPYKRTSFEASEDQAG